MRAYSKWTARIALIALGLGLLAVLAVIPLHPAQGRGTVWPIPHRFGIHHEIADLEMVVVWIIVGIVVLIWAVVGLIGLFERAEWIGQKRSTKTGL